MKKIENKKVYISSQREIMKEWAYERNLGKNPTTYLIDSEEVVWWKCKNGHSWQSVISSRYYGSKCPYCMNRKVYKGFNDLQTLNPILSLEWDYEENGIIKPSDVLAGSNQKVGWKCKNGHKWIATIESRNSRKYGCPYCAGKRVITGINDLKTMNKNLIKEWDSIKNGKLKPDQVSYQSHKKVWWKCKYNHSWKAEVASRYNGNGCPICNNKTIVKGVNDLYTINPELAIEWAKNRNGDLTPRDVSAGSNKRVWWKCSEGHEWVASVNDRNRGKGCPTCANRRVVKGYNDLKTTNPKLAKEWNFKKNKGLRPTQVVCCSNKKVWWKCSNGHEWKTSVNDRNRGSGCPYCYREEQKKRYSN